MCSQTKMTFSWCILALLATISSAAILEQNFKSRETRGAEDDDSCRPKKSEPGSKPCCELPKIISGSPEILMACKEEIGMPDQKQKPPAPTPSSGDPTPPHHGGHHHHHHDISPCIAECFFNKSGLLENGKLDKEAIKKTVDEYLTTDEAWKPISLALLDKCLDEYEKSSTKSGKCASGSSEFVKCFNRGLFLDCIPEKWTKSDECSEVRKQLEKCPSMSPPGLIPKRLHA